MDWHCPVTGRSVRSLGHTAVKTGEVETLPL